MTDTDDIDPFSLPADLNHPANIAARLMLLPEHAHFVEYGVSLGWLSRGVPKEKGGKRELGSVHTVKTMFQGQFKDLCLMMLERMMGYMPDYVVVVDAQWWAQASDIEREALIYHELCHVKQAIDAFGGLKFDRDGLPVFEVIKHDIEAFDAEVRRYGSWKSDISNFLAASRQ